MTHQNSLRFKNISVGKIPNIVATKKPIKPEIHLNNGDQNRKSVSEMTHKPIDKPNKSRLMPNSDPNSHLVTA